MYYNRFRYYSPDEGMYLSHDPIGLAGNNPILYGYVKDLNGCVDRFGLSPLDEMLDLKPGYHAIQGPAGDPGLPEFINDLENAEVNVRGSDVKIIETSSGRVVGEVDVITNDAIIQYKNGASRGSEVSKQILNKTVPYTNKPVLGYINSQSEKGFRTVARANKNRGVFVTNDFNLLADILKCR